MHSIRVSKPYSGRTKMNILVALDLSPLIVKISFIGSVDKMVCREWVHASHKRLVKLRLGPEPALHVTDRKGDKLRTVPLDHTEQLTVLESQVRSIFGTSLQFKSLDLISIDINCLSVVLVKAKR